MCPYHAAIRVKAYLRRRFGDPAGKLPTGFPLFPNAEGGWCAKAGFVATIAEIARRLQLPTVDALGRCTIGEHVWRISGSRYLASLDVPIPVIKLLARWGSDVIVRYVADAPLSALTQVYIDKVRMSDDIAKGLISGPLVVAPTRLPGLETCLSELEDAQEEMDVPEGSVLRPFVVSVTGKIHLVSAPPALGRLDSNRTPCGWRFPESEHQLLSVIPPGGNDKCCRQCGNDSMWGNVHALLSQLECGFESD
jgi:hypothetical protein